MSMRIRRIETLTEFEALAPLWSELASGAGQTSPFLSHDWFWCCWIAATPMRRPEVLLIEEAGSPLAIVPLMKWTDRYRRLPVRCLEFLSSPDTFFADIVAAAEPAAIIGALLHHLGARMDWDLLRLRKLPATSPTLKTLEDLLPDRLPWRHSDRDLSPYVATIGGWESFYGEKSQRFKKTCRNIQNRLERAGHVSIEELRSVEPESNSYSEAIEVTRRGRKANRGVAIATMPGMAQFFAELTRRATKNGWLSLWLLRLNGQAIAMEYQLQADSKVYALRADYDMDFGELSPGSALHFDIVRSAFERDEVHEYDMGLGANEYKLRWATGRHERVTLEVYAPTPYGRLLHGIETRLVPLAREWRDHFIRSS
jgi:CelD/BcsL family acetyltransferase involved in cellulose biosynthesis